MATWFCKTFNCFHRQMWWSLTFGCWQTWIKASFISNLESNESIQPNLSFLLLKSCWYISRVFYYTDVFSGDLFVILVIFQVLCILSDNPSVSTLRLSQPVESTHHQCSDNNDLLSHLNNPQIITVYSCVRVWTVAQMFYRKYFPLRTMKNTQKISYTHPFGP